jgi:hypothetical protein
LSILFLESDDALFFPGGSFGDRVAQFIGTCLRMPILKQAAVEFGDQFHVVCLPVKTTSPSVTIIFDVT